MSKEIHSRLNNTAYKQPVFRFSDAVITKNSIVNGIQKKGSTDGLNQPLVVAIILNWNGNSIFWNDSSIIDSCLRTLARSGYGNLRIVVADAQSQDNSIKFIQQKYKSVTIISVPNVGTPRALNAAIRYAIDRYPGLRYILLLNNDLVFDQDSLRKLVIAANMNPSVGIVGCRLLYPNGSIQHCGSYDTFIGEPTMIRYQTRSGFVLSVVGAVFLVDVEVFKRIGYLDERFSPFGHDDADFCQRARKAGYLTYLVADTCIIHLESYTIRKSIYANWRKWSKEEIDHSFLRGHYLYCLKWHKSKILLLFAKRLLVVTLGKVLTSSSRLEIKKHTKKTGLIGDLKNEIKAISEAISLFLFH